MRRQLIGGSLLLIVIGVVLGATVFRTDIAQATGLAQAVTVSNTASNPVPVREQNLDGGNIKVHEQGTVRVDDGSAPLERTFFVQAEQGVLVTISPAVQVGHRFVARYLSATMYSNNSSFPLTAGACTLFLKRAGDFPLQIGAFSGQVNFQHQWGLSEEVNIPVDAGGELSLACEFQGSVEPSTVLAGVLSGTLIPAA
jgi:hypothetical protein